MNTALSVLCLAFVTAQASDPNRLPKEDAVGYAKLCVEQLAGLNDFPLTMEVDAEKPCAVRGEGGGAMVIPRKELTEEKVSKAGKEVTPVGQIWLRKWTPVVAGKGATSDGLRMMTIKVDDKDRPMPLLLLGVRKKGDKDLELVIYSKDTEPLLTLPMKKVGVVNELPVELEWKRGEKKEPATLTVTVLGKHQAVLPIASLEK